jgi:MFS family permease
VLLTATINAATFFVAQFFQEAQGEPPLAAGLRLLPWTFTPLVVSPVAGALSDRLSRRSGRRPVLVAGMLAQGLGLGWFALAATPDAGYAALPSSATAALGAERPGDLGTASGTVSTVQRLGAAGLSLLGALTALAVAPTRLATRPTSLPAPATAPA